MIANKDRYRIYRLGGKLQAGISHLDVPAPLTRYNICNDFLNPSYIVSGQGYYVDEFGNRTAYGPGSLLIRLPHVKHHQTHEKGPYIDYYFAIPSSFSQAYEELNLISPLLQLGEHEWLLRRFDELAHALQACPESELILMQGRYFQFLAELLIGGLPARPHYREISRGAELLEHSPEQRFPVEGIAVEVGMDYANFRRLFVQYYHMPPMEYRIRKRLEKIQSLLKTTDLSLKEIADRFGYADIYTFARQFKKYVGTSPGQFRKP